MNVPTSKLRASDRYFRFSYGADLEPLILSMTHSGIIDPLIVLDRNGTYEIVCGYRRYLAALKLGLTTVPVTVHSGSDLEAFQMALLENLSVRSFNPLEKAFILRSLSALNVRPENILTD